LLRIEDLVVEFPAGRRMKVHAVSGISLDVKEGETLGLVGESGCGKSTTGRAIMQLPRPTSGRVLFEGTDLTSLSGDALRKMRPTAPVDLPGPDLVAERRGAAWSDIVRGAARDLEPRRRCLRANRRREVLEAVGLDMESARTKRPHQFSGGQCQRICIARRWCSSRR